MGLRVALISPYPVPGGRLASGVEWYTERLSDALTGAGAEVVVIAQEAPSAPEEPVDAVRVRRAWRRGVRAMPAAARAALASAPHAVHLQHEVFLYGGPEALPGLLLGLGLLRRSGLRPVVTLHQVVDPATVDGQFVRLHRVSVPPSLARFGLGTVQGACRRLGRPVVHERAFADQVPGAAVIPTGVDRAVAPERGLARQKLGLEPDRFTVLCFGFLSPYKGLEAALEAARLAGPELQLVLAGGPHPRLAGRDPFAGDLARAYAGVARFTGFVPEADVAPWFGAADLVLAPYPRPFSSSGAVSLALGFGRPVLLSAAMARSMGAPPVMGVDPRPAALAIRLLELARRTDARRELERASSALAAERAWASVAQRHLDLYEEVARERSARGTVRAV